MWETLLESSGLGDLAGAHGWVGSTLALTVFECVQEAGCGLVQAERADGVSQQAASAEAARVDHSDCWNRLTIGVNLAQTPQRKPTVPSRACVHTPRKLTVWCVGEMKRVDREDRCMQTRRRGWEGHGDGRGEGGGGSR